jgi:tetratricopeptide (TPR) repeat protein
LDTPRWTLILILLRAAGAQAQSPLEQAVTLARAQRYAEARKVLEGAAEPSGVPQRIAYHRLKAAVASGLGETANAAGEMREALELAPADSGLLAATAAAELQAERLDDALAHARGAGNTAAAQALIGDIQEKRGQYAEALQAYQAAVALAPDREQYRIALALELVQHYTFEPAIQVLEQAAPLFPKSARIRTLLGVAQYAASRYDDAETALTDAIEMDPKLEPAYGYLAQVALEASSAPPERTLRAVCAREATVCSVLKSRTAREKGDAAAESQAVSELKRAPADSAVARCELGRAYQAAGQWAEARAELETCVRLDPGPQNHYRLGLVYNRLGLTELAGKEMELRRAAEAQKSEETARRQNAVQTFQYLVR